VGLGNPGAGFADTRHNAGFEIVRRFAGRSRIALDRPRFEGAFGEGRAAGLAVGLLLPQTSMNRSGRSVAAALGALPDVDPGEGLLVVYDELDLPLGRIRLRPGGGAGGQRGMQSVLDALGDERFARLRFGIGRPPPGADPRDWVLAPFASDEVAFARERMDVAADAIGHWLERGTGSAMDRYNRAEPESGAS